HGGGPLRDGALGLEHRGDARALRHERAEALEERPRAVDSVEARGGVLAHADHLEGEDLEAGLLDPRQDLPGAPRLYRVRLDDGQRTLDGHFPITLATVAPMSAGLLTNVA